MKTTLFVLLACCSVLLTAQNFKKTATAGFVFLELPVSARTAALGESSVGLPDQGSDAIFNNPASLGFLPNYQLEHAVGITYAPWIADIKHYAASYAWSSPYGVFAAGVNAFDFGTMKRAVRVQGTRTFPDPSTLPDFTAGAMAVSLAYSKMLTDKFSFGISAKYARETIDEYNVSNLLMDGGILYYTGLGSLRIAAVMQNFGTDAQYINDPFKMPVLLRLGAAGELPWFSGGDYRVTAMAESLHPNDSDEKLNTGIEVAYREMFILRGGYKFFYDEESYSFGVGLNPAGYVPVKLDFSYAGYGRLGNLMRFTLQLGL